MAGMQKILNNCFFLTIVVFSSTCHQRSDGFDFMEIEMLRPDLLFDLTGFAHRTLFADQEPVWSALQNLSGYLADLDYHEGLLTEINNGVSLDEHLVIHDNRLIAGSRCSITYGDTTRGGLIISKDGAVLEGASLLMAGAILLGEQISIGRASLIEGGATIKSPTVIGDATEVRQGAYLRGSCLIGDRCVVGHTTEVKHSIFLDDAKAGHFAYLGDSIIGTDANLGAGTKCANLRFIPGTVKIQIDGELVDTGMRKLGAILGDRAQTGCNSVTSPGTILGKKSVLMPNTTAASGYHPDRTRIR